MACEEERFLASQTIIDETVILLTDSRVFSKYSFANAINFLIDGLKSRIGAGEGVQLYFAAGKLLWCV